MKLSRRLAFWVVAGALWFAGGAIAQVSMTLTGTDNGYNMGGVYTSPYQLSIGGTPTWAICDDFTHDIQLNDSWQANPLSLSSVGASGPQTFTTVDWNCAPSILCTIQQEYGAAAILAEDVMANMGNQILSGEYSFAIWTIFDPAAINNLSDAGEIAAVTSYRNGALSQAATSGVPTNYNVTIYTPNGYITGGPDANQGKVAQEFLVISTPEASLPATLVVELSALVGVIFLMRRRLVKFGAPR